MSMILRTMLHILFVNRVDCLDLNMLHTISDMEYGGLSDDFQVFEPENSWWSAERF